MTPRERVLAAFRFEEVRPTPYTVWYDHEALERLNRHFGGASWQNRIHNHILRMSVDWEPETPAGGDHFTDINGTLWRKGTPRHIVEPALKAPSLKGYSIPDYAPWLQFEKPAEDSRHTILPMVSLRRARILVEEGNKSMLTVVGYGAGFFEHAWMIRGYEGFFMDLAAEPVFVEELLDLLIERHLGLLDVILDLPCDGVIFSDDYGDQRGVIIGPPLWRKFIKPRLARLIDRIHARGKMAFLHSCGSVFDILPDLVEVGLDVLQSLQPEAMPVYEIKKRYGRNLRLWGGLGTQRMLPHGTPGEIRAEVRRLKREMGAGGGYVFSSSKPLMQDVPIENAVAFIEAATEED